MSEFDSDGISSESNHQQIVKFIYDLSREMNIEDTQGVVGNELELIALVRNCRFLYDKNLPDFKDVRKKILAWNAIANVMHSQVQEVQQRWRSLREGYNKYKKGIYFVNDVKNDVNSGIVRPWEFYEEMKFIEPYIVPRRSTFNKTSSSNLSEDGDEVNDDSESSIVMESKHQDHNSDIMQLISCIKMHPILYDSKHPQFKSRESKAQAWNKVAHTVGASTSECELKWRTLRERYGRQRKLMDGNFDNKQQWEYFEALSFLDVYIKQRRKSVFRPILPKLPLEDQTTNRVTILNSLSADQPTIILKQLIKNAETQNQSIELLEETKLQPEVKVQHVEFVDASNPVGSPACSTGIPPNEGKATTTEHPQCNNDEDELFGQTVTAELRRMPSGKKKMKIKAEIYKILYENESDE